MPTINEMKRDRTKSKEFPTMLRRSSSFNSKRPVAVNSRADIFKELNKIKEESQKDIKIMELQMLVNSLKKENMDLRVVLNYFLMLYSHKLNFNVLI